jgi:hypothetical protein
MAFDTVRSDLRVTAIIAFVPVVASCASSGLYNMSDEWCAVHLDATAPRCPKDQGRVALNDAGQTDSARH